MLLFLSFYLMLCSFVTVRDKQTRLPISIALCRLSSNQLNFKTVANLIFKLKHLLACKSVSCLMCGMHIPPLFCSTSYIFLKSFNGSNTARGLTLVSSHNVTCVCRLVLPTCRESVVIFSTVLQFQFPSHNFLHSLQTPSLLLLF